MRNLKIGDSTVNSITVDGNLVHTVKLNDGTVVFSTPCSVYIYLSNLCIADSVRIAGTKCGSSYDDTKIKLETPAITFSQDVSQDVSLYVSKISFSGYIDIYDYSNSETRMIGCNSMNFILYPGDSQSLDLNSSDFGDFHDTNGKDWEIINIRPSMNYTIYDTNGGSTSGNLYGSSPSVGTSASSVIIGEEVIDL